MKTDNELDQAIRRLSPNLAPARDLWPELEARLPARTATPWYRRGQWAAAAAFVLVGGLIWQMLPDDPLGNLNRDVAVDMSEDDVASVSAGAQIAQQFEHEIARQLASLDYVSADFGNWQQQLGVWDQAINQVQTVMTEYPDDPDLLMQMQGLYQQQLNYIQLIASVDMTY